MPSNLTLVTIVERLVGDPEYSTNVDLTESCLKILQFDVSRLFVHYQSVIDGLPVIRSFSGIPMDLSDGVCATLMVKLESLTTKSATLATLGAAVRPTLLFVVAFALNITPHEAVHALVSYLLGFSSTLFQMWVDPDAASASLLQLAAIAAAGPIFSLAVGMISWLLYKNVYKWRPSGLFLLMMAIVGIYSFLGPVAGAAFGGDFNIALKFMTVSGMIQYAMSAIGLVLLSVFMFFMGMELSWWAPPGFGRGKNVACTTVAPWLIGTPLVILIYSPLPRFLIGSTLSGSALWVFAAIGATFGYSKTPTTHSVPSLTRLDLTVAIGALLMVRMLAHGMRLAR